MFEDSDATRQRLDYDIFRFSPVTLFWRSEVFQRYSAWFADNGYRVVTFDAATWNSEEAFHEDLSAKLDFPGYYGRNLDALNDCLGELDVSDCDGLTLAVRNYHVFSKSFSRTAQVFLDLLGYRSWHYLLFGKRLVVLVQTDEAAASFDPVGAKPVLWNPEEWLNSKRGL